MSSNEIHIASFSELTLATLHDLMELRVQVFVVEQRCVYAELDGRDREPGARHLWIEDADGHLASYLRLLDEGSGVVRVGRVVSRASARGRGLAGELMTSVTAAHDGDLVLHAQSHLADWYARFGFVVTGDAFDEDGIPHVPMRRSHLASASLGQTPTGDGVDA